MKLLFLIVLSVIASCTVYLFKRSIFISLLFFIFLIGLIAAGIYSTSNQVDIQCSSIHRVNSTAPTSLKTAMDYFIEGNYDYDTGNCQKAISDYTIAIELSPNYVEAYNNRAYTNMRLRNYKDALSDLDQAISLNPNYVNALMNRGDIHNYYYQIDRQSAIADYKKVIMLDINRDLSKSVCGHLFLAEHNGWNLNTFFDLIKTKFNTCDFQDR